VIAAYGEHLGQTRGGSSRGTREEALVRTGAADRAVVDNTSRHARRPEFIHPGHAGVGRHPQPEVEMLQDLRSASDNADRPVGRRADEC